MKCEISFVNKTWKRSFCFGKLYITFSNCRVRKRVNEREHVFVEKPKIIKRRLHEQNDGKCPECGRKFEWHEMELHHVLPWGRFPQYRNDMRNVMLLCPACHKEIHCNPFKHIAQMQAKSDELGVCLKDFYN